MKKLDRVIAPLGPATLVSPADDGCWLICYSRRDFLPEVWTQISNGGPCMFRIVPLDKLELIP